MRVNSVNSPSFKSMVTLDCGGSTKEGSCKKDVSTNDVGTQIYKSRTRINTIGKESFVNEDDFLKKLCLRIKNAQRKAAILIDRHKLPKDEKPISKLFLLLPSYIVDNKVQYFPNLKDGNQKSLREIDLNKIPKILKEMDVPTTSNFKVYGHQDGMGGGLKVTEILDRKGMLTKGKYYTVAITGGGCAVANIRAIGRNKALVDSSGSSYLTEGQSVLKVSKAGACAPSLIRNFCKALGLNEEIIESITKQGIAEFTLSEEFKVPNTPQGERLETLLLDTGKYAIKKTTADGTNILAPFSEHHKEFESARYNAINKYAHALARLTVIRQNECSNGLVVTGTLAKAIDNTCKKDYKKALSEWIMEKFNESYNTFELGKTRHAYGFNVYCGEDFSFDDNTAGNRAFSVSKPVSSDRYNWLEVDLAALRKNFPDKEITNVAKKIRV